MQFIELFLLALGLSMDALAVSICKGLSLGEAKWNHMCIAGAWFGGFQALMPLIGYLLGSLFADSVTRYGHWISFVLLAFIGGKMVWESRHNTEAVDSSLSVTTMLLLATATSIDALTVGVTFAFLSVSILPAVSLIGGTTFICSAIGIKIGSVFGSRYQSRAELMGGIVLILIGVRIVLEKTGILP